MIFLTSGILKFYFLPIKNICSQPGLQKEVQARFFPLWHSEKCMAFVTAAPG